jgi:predicted DNA-binding protein (MmcQ/YjbR family)
MITSEEFIEMALSFPDAIQDTHFDKPSFKINNKIFATINLRLNRAVVRLSESDQDIFSLIPGKVFYPVDSAWAKYGWTHMDLAKVDRETAMDALQKSYEMVFVKKKK